ncbi:GNAT family N-acetyltransferase [Flavobacterium sp.]|uniref:GNAT family N-acetyltransferase n=1 Tax=Flavobacterium sp. TaxID=239 RepID=UPI00260240C1|nr:GNAT family N-acetyltransferase [Flavobacterium sp.]MDD3004584.1 GNAT family N-acetyltransferase [Flavobacterium sp.]
MVTIEPANTSHFGVIKELAYQIWPATYKDILTQEQLYYMLELFYNEEALKQNTLHHHQFILIKEHNKCIGFADYELNYQNEPTTRIHKIYLLPETQGKGYGNLLMQYIENKSIEANNIKLSLNVNRFNKAQFFYKKMGFEIVFEEDVQLDFGYLMEDFRMEKKLYHSIKSS